MYGCSGLVNSQERGQRDRRVVFPKIIYICTETSNLKEKAYL